MKFLKKKPNKFRLTVLVLAVVALLAVIFVAWQNNYGNLFSGHFMRLSPTLNRTETVTPSYSISDKTDELTINQQRRDDILAQSDVKDIDLPDSGQADESTINQKEDEILATSDVKDIDLPDTVSIDTVKTTTSSERSYESLDIIETETPIIDYVSVNQLVFNPDKEGVNITWNMEGISPATKLYIYITNSEGSNIFLKQFTSTEDPSYLKPGEHSWYWDGKGYKGDPVPYNSYRIQVYGKRNTDNIAPNYASATAVPPMITRQGDASTPTWPYTEPTLGGLRLISNSIDSSGYQFNIVFAFELHKTSGDNVVKVDFRTTEGSTLQSFQVKDLPAGTYYYEWDGTKYDGETVKPKPMSGKSFRFAVSGTENGVKMNETGHKAVIEPFSGS